MSHGLILFAHGARDPRWAAPFEDTAARIRTRLPRLQVRTAFLDFMTPDLAGAVDELAAAGCSRVDVVPMFLGSGGHVRQDLPRLLDELRGRHAGLDLRLHTAIGEMPAVVQAMADAAAVAAQAAEDGP